MNFQKLFALTILIAGTITTLSAQCNGRYETALFTDVNVTQDIVYGWNTNFDNNVDTVKMDIYEPDGDTMSERPVVILAHGGSFVGGSKNMTDMVSFCTNLAKRGYVAVSINYRIGSSFNLSNTEEMVKTVFRAVQDGGAAVRYMRRTYAEMNNPYGVDTSAIHIGGSSAGAILALHVAFMDDTSKLIPAWQGYVEDLGGLEGTTGSSGYSSKVNAILSFAGAIADTLFIDSENALPVFSSHAEDDNTVKYDRGYPLGLSSLPNLSGSSLVHERLVNLETESVFASYSGDNHPPYFKNNNIVQEIFEETDSIMSVFLYRQQECYVPNTVSTSFAQYPLNQMTMHPNPSNGQVRVSIEGIGKNNTLEVYDAVGKQVLKKEILGDYTDLDMSHLQKGVYFLRVLDADQQYYLPGKKLILH